MRWAIIPVILLLLASLYLPLGVAQRQAAVIYVSDPLGNPMEGVEVILRKGETFHRFLTNSTGYAVFTELEAGEYAVEVKLEDVVVAKAVLRYPEELRLNITAQVAEVEIRVFDLDGKPAEKLGVRLDSGTGKVVLTGLSGREGLTRLERIPYSTLEDVGGYQLEVTLGEVTLLREPLEIYEPVKSFNFTAPLINLNITFSNLEGERFTTAIVELKAGKFSRTVETKEGVAGFRQIPSSEVEEVGEYLINVTAAVGRARTPIYSEKRSITSSGELDLILPLVKLNVTVVDEEGAPVKGLRVYLSNEKASNFTVALTGDDGVVYFSNIPLSGGKAGAGKYLVQVFRAGSKVGEAEATLTEARNEVKVRVTRIPVTITLLDYMRNPLAGYRLTLKDTATGEVYEAETDEDGSAELKLFLGAYELQVIRGESVIHRETVELSGNRLELRLESVNFPYTVRVLDALGAPLKSSELRITFGGEVIYQGPPQNPLQIQLAQPGYLTIDILHSGKLIHRETLIAEEPGRAEIRLKTYIETGGGLVALEDLGFTAASAAAAIILAFGVFLTYRGLMKRKLITE